MGGFREDLDLSGFIDRYKTHLTSEAVMYTGEGNVRERDPSTDPIPEHLYREPIKPGQGVDPEKVGTGPHRASTSRVLATSRPLFAWDPNRYYRDLGLAWPYVNATRTMMRQAYVTLDGPNNRRLTYCFKQLLDPEVREAYDATPLGKQYLDDIYVQEARKRRAMDEVDRRRAQGQEVTVDQVLEEDGMIRLTPEEEAEIERMKALDSTASNGKDDSAVGADWQYSFYLWRTTSYNRSVLREFQEALVREVEGKVPAVVVGMMGNQPHRFFIAEADGEVIVFLNRDRTLTPDLVSAAATALINHV